MYLQDTALFLAQNRAQNVNHMNQNEFLSQFHWKEKGEREQSFKKTNFKRVENFIWHHSHISSS